MLTYQIDNSIENRRFLEIALKRKGLEIKVIHGFPVILNDDYEIGEFRRAGRALVIEAFTLSGPGSLILELIAEIEDLMVNGEDPLGDHHQMNR